MDNDHAEDILGIVTDGEHLACWRNGRVWQLAQGLPVERLDIRPFLEQIERDRLYNQDDTPADIKHARVMAADLDFPIVVSARGWLFDGYHRVQKAQLLGHTHIKAVRFIIDPEPDYRKKINASGEWELVES
jgi:hypothetical protein